MVRVGGHDPHARVDSPAWSGTGDAGTVLLLPGATGGILQPSVYWSSLALAAAGWHLLVAHWPDRGAADHVVPIAEAGLTRLDASARRLVLGKSIGSLAAPIVSAAGIPAVWLTPLLDRDAVADALAVAAVPTLVIGGAEDPTWRTLPKREGLEVVELPGANHGLMIEGDWRSSMRSISDAVENVERFAARLEPAVSRRGAGRG